MGYPEIHELGFKKRILKGKFFNHEYLVVISDTLEDEKLFNALGSEIKRKATKVKYIEFIDLFQKQLNDFRIILISNNCEFDQNAQQKILDLKIHNKEVYSLNSFVEHTHKKIFLSQAGTNYFINSGIINVRINRHYVISKRFFDISFSLILLPIASILTLIGIIGIFLSTRGNPFFLQERVGKNDKKFTIYKLRTMLESKSSNTNCLLENTNKIFTFGKYLRILKIDELPQIINVLRGEMSYIGPRPETVRIVNMVISEYPIFNLRHLISPGITGWAQVNMPKATPADNMKKLEYDLYYIKNQSYFLDLKIILQTIRVIATRNSN